MSEPADWREEAKRRGTLIASPRSNPQRKEVSLGEVAAGECSVHPADHREYAPGHPGWLEVGLDSWLVSAHVRRQSPLTNRCCV